MPDSVQIIADMVAHLDTYPKMANGDLRVDDPTAVAVAFVGIAAPVYGAEVDDALGRAVTAETLAAARQDELIGLRSDIDYARAAIAQARGALEAGDLSAARTVLAAL